MYRQNYDWRQSVSRFQLAREKKDDTPPLCYGQGFPTGFLVGSIQKLDVDKKRFTATWEDPSCRATEPLFVPRPGGSKEEDGVVVFACLGTNRSEPMTALVVLEPGNLEELGRFSVPTVTPIGFHGVWAPGKIPEPEQRSQ